MQTRRTLLSTAVGATAALAGCSGLQAGPLAGRQHSHENGTINVSVEGEFAAGETVTLAATHDDQPVGNATVRLAGTDRTLGRTGADGRLRVTVPEDGNRTLVVETDSLRGRYDPDDRED